MESFLTSTPVLIPPVVELTRVSLRDRLSEVSLAIRPGEYVAVVGSSGSGTSTLMHILGCLDVPTSGEYWLAGYEMNGRSQGELADIRNRRIGFVFRPYDQLPARTVRRNVELPLKYARVGRAERRTRALAALERVGLADRVEHRAGDLSAAQRQRVAAARALVIEPVLILADEPDADLLSLFDELHAAGQTIILSTPDHEVAARAGRVVRLRDGAVVSDRLKALR